MNSRQVKTAGPLHFRTRNKLDPFGAIEVAVGSAGAKLHPRRDDQGHGDEGGKETPEEKETREKTEADAAAKAKTKSPEQKAAEKAARDALTEKANVEKELADLKAKHQSADEAAIEASVKEKLATAVSAKEVELTDAFSTTISQLQDDIIDSTIDRAFDAAGRTREQFKTVLATLDRRTFVGDDGKVNKEEVTKWASELAGSSSARPPRTGGVSSGGRDRGFGHLLAQQN